jgi:hypothetical protein
LLTAILRCVTHMEDDIRDGIIIELSHVRGQFQAPLADVAGKLERMVPFVAQVRFEQSA